MIDNTRTMIMLHASRVAYGPDPGDAAEMAAYMDSANALIAVGYQPVVDFAPEGGSSYIDPNTGFAATLWKNETTKEVIVAFRGTEPNAQDVYTDLNLGVPQWKENRERVINYLSNLTDEGYGVNFTGHSLGGALAQYAAYDLLNTSDDSSITLTTFNGLGGNDGLQNIYGTNYNPNILTSLNSDAIRHYVANGDLVASFGGGHLGGNTYRLGGVPLSFLDAHVMPNLFDLTEATGIVDDQPFTPNYVNIRDLQGLSSGISTWFGDSTHYSEREAIARTFMGALEGLSISAYTHPGDINELVGAFSKNLYEAGELPDVDAYNDLMGTDWASHIRVRGVAETLLSIALEFLDAAEYSDLEAWYDQFLQDVGGFYGDLIQQTSRDFERILHDFDVSFNGFLSSFIRRDPLILDLDGDGIETIAEAGFSGVKFDYEGDGIRTPTGWVGADDGLLVLDRDGNGSIDTGAELFSDYTPLDDGTFARNGVEALRTVDENGDGMVNANDAQFANLRVWRDADQDGVSDAAELLSFAELGITAIDANLRTPGPGEQGNGNVIEETIAYSKSDGSVGTIGEVWFRETALAAEFTDQIALTPEAQALPDVQGLGMVRDLREAMSLDTSGRLTALVQQFSGATTASEQLAIVDQLIDAWADTSTMRFFDGGIYMTDVADNWQFDCRVDGVLLDHLAVQVRYAFEGIDPSSARQEELEARLGAIQRFNGRNFFDVQDQFAFGKIGEKIVDGYASGVNVVEFNGVYGYGRAALQTASLGLGNITALENAYSVLREYVYQSLVIQTRLAPYLDAISVIGSAGKLRLDFSGIETYFDAQYSTDPVNAIVDLAELLKFRGPELAAAGWNGADKLLQAIETEGRSAELMAGLAEVGIHTVDSESSMLTGDNYRNLLLGGQAAERLEAHDGNDYLIGAAGNDSLDGGAGNDALFGGDGDDSLGGGDGNDVIDGGAGNDRYGGGGGNDVFRFGRGSGNDELAQGNGDGGTDAIELAANVAPTDVRVSQANGSPTPLELSIIGTTDTLLVTDFFERDRNSLEEIRFADGTVWHYDDMLLKALDGSDGNDIIFGYASDDVLRGFGGNDHLSGWEGNDTLLGGDGGDVLLGGDGNDDLDGGVGNDLYDGGNGDDVYRFGRGAGSDEIYLRDYASAEIDVIELGPDIAPSDVTVRRNDIYVGSLELSINGTTDTLLVRHFVGYREQTVAEVRFADGTVWNYDDLLLKMLDGSDGDDVIRGYASDDVLTGYGGNDAITGWEGNDTLIGGSGNDLVFGGKGNDLLLGESGDDSLSGGEGDDVIDGGAGNDTLSGDRGNDVFRFGRGGGQDTLYDLDSNPDKYDVIELDGSVTPDDVQLHRVGATAASLEISFTGAEDKLLIRGFFDGTASKIEAIRFADGTVWNYEELIEKSSQLRHGTEGDDTLQGTAVDETFYGKGGNDVLDGDGGKDTLYGQAGNDTLIGGEGDDRFMIRLDDGLDTVRDNAGVDGVVFDASISVADIVVRREGDSLALIHRNGRDKVVVENWFTASDKAVERVEFADGTVWDVAVLTEMARRIDGTTGDDVLSGSVADEILRGLAGDDQLYGGGGDDTLDGGDGHDVLGGNDGNDTVQGGAGNDAVYGDAGNDVLIGQTGNDELLGGRGDDRYVIALGDGTDTVWDDAGVEAVVFDASVMAADIVVRREGDDLALIHRNGTDKVVVVNWFTATDKAVETVEFADGTVWDVAMLADMARRIDGTAGDDLLAGSHAEEIFRGFAGNDEIWTGAGNDTVEAGAGDDFVAGQDGNDGLAGNEGNDTLYGDAGDDTLEGGAGNDTLLGNTGNDTFLFRLGDGADTLWEQQGIDVVRFDASVAVADLGVQREGNNLVLAHVNTVDRLTIVDWFVSADLPVERVEFADGTVWTQTEINAQLGILRGTAGNDTLTGTSGNDTLLGYAGNDVLSGAAGNDQLQGHEGNDTLDGGTGVDTLTGGSGDDTYVVDNASDSIIEAVNEGTDLVQSAVTYTLAANVENLLLTGTVSINGTGNGRANVITGNSANNTLRGGGGADTLRGLAGDDIYIVDSADVVEENEGEGMDTVRASVTVTLAANVDNLVMTGTAAVQGTGNELANILRGNSASNTLSGGAGDDYLDGRAGSDVMYGGSGNDTYVVDTAADAVVENAEEGIDTVRSAVTLTLAANTENLVLTGTTAIHGTGNELANTLTGNSASNTLSGEAGDDYLDGRGGSDTMSGGIGDDIYVVNASTDVVVENPDEGMDTVHSVVTTTLGANVENLTLAGARAIRGTGNTLDNVITGNTATNILSGDAGNDTLWGGAGNDVLDGGAGNDTYGLNRGDGSDTVNQNDATALNDQAQFGADINRDQLWFRRNGNHLEVSVIGTHDTLSFTNWYSGAQYHVDQFRTATGETLLDAQVQQLVDAMAAFSPPPLGQLNLTAEQQAALEPVLASSWQPAA